MLLGPAVDTSTHGDNSCFNVNLAYGGLRLPGRFGLQKYTLHSFL